MPKNRTLINADASQTLICVVINQLNQRTINPRSRMYGIRGIRVPINGTLINADLYAAAYASQTLIYPVE